MEKRHFWHRFIKRKIIFGLDKILSIFGKSSMEIQKIFVRKNLKRIKSDYGFFIVTGCSRSGTTLLETVLSTHPDIKSPLGEFDFSSTDFREEFNKNFGIEIKNITTEQVEKLFKEFSGSKKLLIKRPNANLYLDILEKHFPNIKIIDIVRDGRDVAVSAKKSNHLTWPVSFSARQWKTIIKHTKEYQDDPNFIQIKYEDLMNKPLKTVNSIFKFLNLNKIDEIKNFYEVHGIKNNKKADNSNRPLDNSSIGRWRNEMTEREKRMFKRISGEELIKLDYEKNNQW